MLGFSTSRTITRKTQLTALLLASRAVQVTRFVPLPNELPEGGAQVSVTPGQLSEPSGANVTTASHRLVAQLTVMSDGHWIVGGAASRTVTVNWQAAEFVPESMTVQLTTVAPTANTEPLGGEQFCVTPLQLSLTAAV